MSVLLKLCGLQADGLFPKQISINTNSSVSHGRCFVLDVCSPRMFRIHLLVVSVSLKPKYFSQSIVAFHSHNLIYSSISWPLRCCESQRDKGQNDRECFGCVSGETG